jgi:hypothetical protein
MSYMLINNNDLQLHKDGAKEKKMKTIAAFRCAASVQQDPEAYESV